EPEPEPAPEPEPEPEPAPLEAGAMVSIPAGPFLAGSAPGVPWRRARDEADLVEVSLGAFRIDRLPYPNDPDQSPRTHVTANEAAALCDAEGKRLCSELEWERACKGGNAERLFPTGPNLDLETCANSACASPEDVLRMGVLAGEWTASSGNRGLEASTRIFRGAAPDAELLHRHRCAARRAAEPATLSANLGFRCCAGPVQTATYPEERDPARFRRMTPSQDELRAMLRSIPELAPWADDFVHEDAESMARALQDDDADLRGWELTGGPLRWSPRTGDVAWVLAGRSRGDALVAVLYTLPDGSFRHASSFVLRGENTPIAVAFTPPSRGELLWSPCWGCLGEGGAIRLREDGALTVSHR
ncbi:MAG: SUMF1/EgtB/PvdO family nonheme iron enzyme, partial [Myxococcota bacterium]